MMRKMIKLMSISKILTEHDDGSYGLTTETPKGAKEMRFRLDEPFQFTTMMENRKHTVLSASTQSSSLDTRSREYR